MTMHGYEIHMGVTGPVNGADARPLCRLATGEADGYIVDGSCMGTYIHGILDNSGFVDFILSPFAERITEGGSQPFDYAAFKNEQYDRLADHVRKHVDMELLYGIMRGEK